MADLTDGFEMGGSSPVGRANDPSPYGHDKMVEVMNAIYEHSQYKYDTLEQSRMWVYACERFDAWFVTTDKNFWSSITNAVQDTLQKYPLNGYEPGQGGFGKGKYM